MGEVQSKILNKHHLPLKYKNNMTVEDKVDEF